MQLSGKIEFQILFEDDFLFVLDKPPCVHSVISPRSDEHSVAQGLLAVLPGLEQVSEKKEDAGLVNRLDFETSGVLLGAKSREVWLALREMLKRGAVQKSYLALLEGRLEDAIEIETYIGSSGRHSGRVKIFEKHVPKGVRALKGKTRFEPERYLFDGRATLVRAYASPARRHQVRAHAAHIGFPLVGDGKYGAKLKLSDVLPERENQGSGPDFILHAERISFIHPISRVLIEIVSERSWI